MFWKVALRAKSWTKQPKLNLWDHTIQTKSIKDVDNIWHQKKKIKRVYIENISNFITYVIPNIMK